VSADLPLAEIVNGVFALAVLGLGARLNNKVNRVRDDAAATRYQVENNHIDEHGNPINLREEADGRHSENSEKLDSLARNLDRVRDSVARIWERTDRHTDQIHELELTQPRAPNKGAAHEHDSH